METELFNKITNEQKDKALNQTCLLIWLQVQKGFGPIALSSKFPVFSTSIWPLLPNLLSCFEIWKPFLCQLIDVVLHRKVCSQSPINKVLQCSLFLCVFIDVFWQHFTSSERKLFRKHKAHFLDNLQPLDASFTW